MGYRGFPGSICASPNSMVVHGIPGSYRRSARRHLSIDVGVMLDGWVADAAITLPVGNVTLGREQAAHHHRRPRCSPGSSNAAPATGSATSRTRSSSASRRRLRGDPRAGRPRHRPRHARGSADPELRRARHRPAARGRHGAGDRADGQRRRPRSCGSGSDNWSVYSQDGSLAAHFEHTVAITAEGPRILTPWHLEESAKGTPATAAQPASAARCYAALTATLSRVVRGRDRLLGSAPVLFNE